MAEYVVQTSLSVVRHPLNYAVFLTQIGHEPMAPTISKTLGFGAEKYYYPNILQYILYLKQQEGFFCLYRGIIPKLVGDVVGNVTSNQVSKQLKKYMKEKEETMAEKNMDDFVVMAEVCLLKCIQDVSARCVSVLVSQPFHVIMLRSMAQFIGKEEIYCGLWSASKEIYNHDGVLGFFAGIIPRLIGEVGLIVFTNVLSTIANRYLVDDNEDLQSWTPIICVQLVKSFTYQFTLTGNIMAINGSGLAAAYKPYMPVYANWIDCKQHLKKQKLLHRGSKLFFRVCN